MGPARLRRPPRRRSSGPDRADQRGLLRAAPVARLGPLRRIRTRLRRCRDVSVYVVGGRELAWGCCHDEPAELDAALAEVEELATTRHAVIDASRRIAAYRGRWELAMRLQAQLDALALSDPPRLLIRRGEWVFAQRRRRLIVDGVALFTLALVVATLAPVPVAAVVVLAVGLGFGARIRSFKRQQRRFDRLLAAAAFSTAGRLTSSDRAKTGRERGPAAPPAASPRSPAAWPSPRPSGCPSPSP